MWDSRLHPQHTTLFVPVSKGTVISDLKSCLNVSLPLPEQCLLAFSASSQSFLRFNSESQAILECSTSKQGSWQLRPQKRRETARRNLIYFPSVIMELRNSVTFGASRSRFAEAYRSCGTMSGVACSYQLADKQERFVL
jgi:hypothetical protein